MKLIPLTQGYEAMVDDEDYLYLNQWKWQIGKSGTSLYARRTRKPTLNNSNKFVGMHNEVILIQKGETPFENAVVDHINGDGLDNRGLNLRWSTVAQNGMNKKSERTSSSKYKGVSVMNLKRGNLTYWHAQISKDRKSKHLGTFPYTNQGEIEAAKCYDKAAKEYQKEFARLNFPSDVESNHTN